MPQQDPQPLRRVLAVDEHEPTAPVPDLTTEELHDIYRSMVRIRLLDEKLLRLQRQGRIAFFGPFAGQEAAIVGSGFVARPCDWIFPALREAGILFMRGFPMERYLGQVFGNSLDPAQGRQQPMHFSSKEHNFVSLSSVIATQLPQAVGAAWAARIRGDDCVVFGYMGDGATSEHDFHAALTFAGVGKVPAVLICQNNQWAISVPFEQQTASQGVAVKARAYGLPGVAVDGNDVLAVVSATRAAHERAKRGDGATLLELVTYRRGGHSSSDDPGRYRDESKVPSWLLHDPIRRLGDWLQEQGLWGEERDRTLRDELKRAIDEAIAVAENAPLAEVSTLFDHVYGEMPPHLEQQMASGLLDGEDQEIQGAFPL